MAGVAGRDEEKIVPAKIKKSGETEPVAVYGRRQVGKPTLSVLFPGVGWPLNCLAFTMLF